MRRFFVPAEDIKDEFALIRGAQAHHILDVLRMKKGAILQLFDGQGRLYQGKILVAQDKQVRVQIESVTQSLPQPELSVTLVQALPKKNKMDDVVEKATELGVDTIIPVETARTIVKLHQTRLSAQRMRWQRKAQEAAKQCGRLTVPKIENLLSWPAVLSILDDLELKLLFALDGQAGTLKDILRRQHQVKRLAILIGPEGDFTPEEVRQAKAAGCLVVSLGKNVLRVDTAGICALAMVNYALRL